ncbi:hypothetical protein [Falsirhodobacter sp. 20TX0035]|uniref:hypothetical protein n=1 Tax=Falsirhodobacter sp. 20TX0035 TaxID=3022019 RepID=UPI00232BDE3D|nr:hypothetical protein [Falsirhodobacter sp. 20TX0035]MDB6453082.1 hypothetical protein [Falsirhodobacter sp. 20TX0035]
MITPTIAELEAMLEVAAAICDREPEAGPLFDYFDALVEKAKAEAAQSPVERMRARRAAQRAMDASAA